MTSEEYLSAIQNVKQSIGNVQWCIESGASWNEVHTARANLVAAENDLDRLISQATLRQREAILLPAKNS